MDSKKCVLIIDKGLPQGLIANTAAVLTLSLGKIHPELVGEDVQNKNGEQHRGITRIPIPILAGTPDDLKRLRAELMSSTTVVDFSNIAQTTKNYGDYSRQLASAPVSDIEYLGIAVYGDKKIVSKHTGNMRLIR